jgi:hypothetical protein
MIGTSHGPKHHSSRQLAKKAAASEISLYDADDSSSRPDHELEDILTVPIYQLYLLNQTLPKGPFFNSTSSSFLTRCNSNFTPAHTAPETGPSYKNKLYA